MNDAVERDGRLLMARKEVRLTVATATKNAVLAGRSAGLRRCVRSVGLLPFSHEHLVRDGGSQDGTVDVLNRLSCEVSGLKIASLPDGGIYDALNGALAVARGEWFLVMGDDDEIINSSTLLDVLESSGARNSDVMVSPVALGDGRLFTARPQLVLGGMSCPHQGMLVRTSLLRAIGGFDVRYRIAGDYDMFLKLMLSAARLSCFDRPFAYFSMGTGISRDPVQCGIEDAAVLASALGLSAHERNFRLRNRVLPLCCSIRLLFHASPFIRASARWQIAKRTAQLFGLLKGTK